MATLDEALFNIFNGSAVLFVGAGFSLGGLDRFGKNVPSSAELTGEIRCIIPDETDDNESLTEITEFCQAHPDLDAKLRSLLVSRLTNCEPSKTQKEILSLPWRAVFTTNFDDLAENSIGADSCHVVTPTTSLESISRNKTPIYHLHGRARDILEKTVDPIIVISEKNYLDLHRTNARLLDAFSNETYCAKTIVFIGYSIKDAEIASRLLQVSEDIRTKTIVICAPSPSRMAISRLGKFGEVYPLGVDGFAGKLREFTEVNSFEKNAREPVFALRHVGPSESRQIEKAATDGLILTGNFDHACFMQQMTNPNSPDTYCVYREKQIDLIFNQFKNRNNRFVVRSDIGNGKTIFLEQLKYACTLKGYTVFSVNTKLNEVFEELEVLLKKTDIQFFIVDNFDANRQVVEFISSRLTGSSVLVTTSGNARNSHMTGRSLDAIGKFYEVDLNLLDAVQLAKWDQHLERWGYWENRIELNAEARNKFLRVECSSENRSIVISIFKHSRLAKKIEDMIHFFVNSKPEHVKAFVAILICTLCQKHVEWSRIVGWLYLDESKLRKAIASSAIFDFLVGSSEWFRFASTQLADYIFKSFDFDDQLVVGVFTDIAVGTAKSGDDPRLGFDAKENLRQLVKFRSLTKIFGDSEAAMRSIEAIYSRLARVSVIRDQDQFWLQYAMANMETGNLPDAESYINTALGLARKRGMQYEFHQIIDQHVRLRLLKNSMRGPKWNRDEIQSALADLKNLLKRKGEDLIYPLRASKFILGFLEEKSEVIDSTVKLEFIEITKELEAAFAKCSFAKARKGEEFLLKDFIKRSRIILQN
jgi:hypothetical protein